jgi:hypothetical protein
MRVIVDTMLGFFSSRPNWDPHPLTRRRVCPLGYSDYDVYLENDRGSWVYRCKKLF